MRRATEAPIGGIKVVAENGWFAARPSGTEDVYKIYAESFRGQDHLKKIQEEAQAMVASAVPCWARWSRDYIRRDRQRAETVGAIVQQVANALQADVGRRIFLEHFGVVRIVPCRTNTVVTRDFQSFLIASRMRSLSSTST